MSRGIFPSPSHKKSPDKDFGPPKNPPSGRFCARRKEDFSHSPEIYGFRVRHWALFPSIYEKNPVTPSVTAPKGEVNGKDEH